MLIAAEKQLVLKTNSKAVGKTMALKSPQATIKVLAALRIRFIGAGDRGDIRSSTGTLCSWLLTTCP